MHVQRKTAVAGPCAHAFPSTPSLATIFLSVYPTDVRHNNPISIILSFIAWSE